MQSIIKSVFLVLLILLTACTTAPSPINITNTTNVKVNVSTNTTIVSVSIINKSITPAINDSDIFSTNFSINKNSKVMKKVMGTEHVIEVLDVTENADACLIKVDGVVDLINNGATKVINGVRIFVAHAYAFNSFAEDKDVCQLVIAKA